MSEVIVPDPVQPTSRELRINRKQTRQYIRANPTELVITRSTREDDGAGGKRKTNPQVLGAQTVRIIQAQESKMVERINSDGKVVRPELNLMAEWDADIEVGDVFPWGDDDSTAEVVYIQNMGYELICEVAT